MHIAGRDPPSAVRGFQHQRAIGVEIDEPPLDRFRALPDFDRLPEAARKRQPAGPDPGETAPLPVVEPAKP